MQNLLVPQPCRAAQNIHLISNVVDIVFRLNIVTGLAENIAQGISHRRAAAMPHMQRTRWIGAHIFNKDLLPIPHLQTAEVLAGFCHL